MKLRKSSCTLFAAAALALAGCGESDSTTYTNPVPDLLITTQQEGRKASGAKGSADMSLKDATTKATMLSAVKVKGESSDAEANAQAILAAKDKVDSALTEANAALTALQKAKTEADGLPADTPKLAELKAELATAITDATRHRDDIKAIKDATGTGSLAKLVEKVTGTGDKKMTPADIAAAVAVEVEKAMVFKGGLADAARPPITGVPRPGVTTAFHEHDYIISLSTNYPEIRERYLSSPVVNLPGVRVEKTDYATYGYWLNVSEKQNAIVETYIFALPRYAKRADGALISPNADWGNTATYSGKALGISVLTARDGKNRKAIKSGEFTADVKLTANFAPATPTIRGTVTNFKGDAVGSDWSVKLKDKYLRVAPPPSVGGFTSDYWGLTQGSGARHDGAWHAKVSYVPTDKERPTSIIGTFQSFFADGRARGGYATVKDE